MNREGLKILLLFSLAGSAISSSKPVSIRDKSIGQLVTSSLLTWETFNVKGDAKEQFEFAITGGNFPDNDAVYLCRSSLESVLVTGFVIKRSDEVYACIVSQHGQVRLKPDFDLLINKGNGAKLEWKNWEKLIPFTQGFDGAVSTGGSSRSEIYYVARHKINHTTGYNAIDHAIGWFDQSSDLGKIHAIFENKERSFENGEILIVVEAARYELYDVKFKTAKLRESRKRTLLGQTILKNEGIEESDVNAVIGYEHEIIRNFGTHEGIARSVNTTFFISKSETFDFFWGIQKSEKGMSSKVVGTRLLPKTAVNVTLWANYTIKDGPYDAYLFVYFVDGTKSKKKKITVASGYEATIENPLEIEYSETYWIHNDTIVPTTTKRTITSSSTSTHRSVFQISTMTNEVTSITEKSKQLSDENFIMEFENDSKDDRSKGTRIKLSSITIIGCMIFRFTAHLCFKFLRKPTGKLAPYYFI